METKTESVPERRAPSPGVDSPSLLPVSQEKGAGSLWRGQHTEGRMAAWEGRTEARRLTCFSPRRHSEEALPSLWVTQDCFPGSVSMYLACTHSS